MSNVNSDQILLSFSLNDCKKGASYLIEFYLENSEKQEHFKTELIKKATESIKFSTTFLCNYNFSKIQLCKLVVTRWKSRQNMASFKVKENHKLTLSTLVSSKNSIFQTNICEKLPNSEIIIIEVKNPNYTDNNLTFTLFDYLKAGITLEGYIGIDFTSGIEHITDTESNQYLQAIAGIREIVFDFIRDFEVYGYGAKIIDSNDNNNNDYFNLSLQENNVLRGYTNIENAYIECLNKIKFSDNNSLSPLINNIRKVIYNKYKADTYSILFLLINSPPKNDDFQNTIDALIENSFLPLSIVVIGIGNSEFEDIKRLFSNKNKISSKGMEKSRNNIHFISMKDCNFNNDILKNRCLKDIPKQMVQYYSLNKTTPKNIKEQNFDNIKESFKVFENNNSLCEFEDCAPPSLMDIQQSENKDINIGINDNNNNINNNNIINIENNNNSINEKNNNLYEKPGNINNNNNLYKNLNNNDNDYKKSGQDINHSNIYINATPGKDEDMKINNNYIQNPYQKEKKYINDNKINNINNNQIIMNNKDDKRIANETPKGEKMMVNETTKGPNKENNPKNRIDNPYAKNKNDEEEIKEEVPKNNDNVKNNNEEKKYFNQTPGNEEKKYFNQIHGNVEKEKEFVQKKNEEKKYVNQTPGNEEKEEKKFVNQTPGQNINNNNKIVNPYKSQEEKKFYNQTPNPEEKNKFDNYKKYVNNPFGNKNKINQKNVGKINNPFKKENQKNDIPKDNYNKSDSINFDQLKNNKSNLGESNAPHANDYSVDI